jgi:rsbT co-antagonist protein RsbR
MAASTVLGDLLTRHEDAILKEWIEQQLATTGLRSELMGRSDLQDQSRRLLAALRDALQQDSARIDGAAFEPVRRFLEDLGIVRAKQGYTPTETATFIFSLKQPIFARLRDHYANDASALASAMWETTLLLDRLGLFTAEVYQRGREHVIARQQEAMLELSTPVVTLWDGVLALPLIGTPDSERTQVVMESLLQRIVSSGASLAVIDITGVPTVDTVTAQHLLKTVAAARLMGADCILSGIRPQIAQTIVHLGVDLGNIVTKATLADAFAVALKRLGLTVQRAANARGAAGGPTRGESSSPSDEEETPWNGSRS